MWYTNIAGRFFGLVTKHECDRRTDRGRIDGQNYDFQDRASIAASRGKNHFLYSAIAAEYRSRRWMWSTLPPTVRSLWHSPAN